MISQGFTEEELHFHSSEVTAEKSESNWNKFASIKPVEMHRIVPKAGVGCSTGNRAR